MGAAYSVAIDGNIENRKECIVEKYAKYRDQSAYDRWKYELEHYKKEKQKYPRDK